ncbi:MAG TPA: sulfotransferase [Bacteroidia bacterium]|jgi:hypothetical protein
MLTEQALGINEARANNDTIVPKIGLYFHLTSSLRILPSFFIAGVQKGGSTSLCNYLYAHPEIIPAQRKDIFYFNNPVHYAKGLNWYKAHFALKLYKMLYDKRYGTDAITLDSTPNYFEAAHAAGLIHRDFPQTKIIFILRNPVDRAWSSYQMAKRFGFEEKNFEEALALEEQRLDEEEKKIKTTAQHNYVFQRLSYKKRGIYINYIPQWQKHFPAENLLILKSEDLFEKPQETFNKVTDFLKIKRCNTIKFDNHNPGSYSEDMNPETRASLSTFYEPYNQQLYTLLGQNYGWK